MTTQLQLIDGGGRRPWRLDSKARAVGRRGVALARLELERARPVVSDRPLSLPGDTPEPRGERRAG